MFYNVCIYQIIVLYTLSIYNFIYQLYLNRAEDREERKEDTPQGFSLITFCTTSWELRDPVHYLGLGRGATDGLGSGVLGRCLDT